MIINKNKKINRSLQKVVIKLVIKYALSFYLLLLSICLNLENSIFFCTLGMIIRYSIASPIPRSTLYDNYVCSMSPLFSIPIIFIEGKIHNHRFQCVTHSNPFLGRSFCSDLFIELFLTFSFFLTLALVRSSSEDTWILVHPQTRPIQNIDGPACINAYT